MRLAPLFLCGTLAACVPPAPLSVSGTLPPAGTYTLIAGETVSLASQATLARGLAARGLIPAAGKRPDRLVALTFADRPRTSGAFAGDASPATADAPQWVDQPGKGGWFGKGRREVRLTLRFLSPDGQLREQRTATEVVGRRAPTPDQVRLIEAALTP